MTKRIRDYRNAGEVAAILAVINPHGYNEDMLISDADRQFHKEETVFYGTGGWYCTFYPIHSDAGYTHDAIFTVMPFAILTYLRSKGENL